MHKSIGLKSRYSQASNKSRQQTVLATATKDQDGRLTRIDEDGAEKAEDGEADGEKSKK